MPQGLPCTILFFKCSIKEDTATKETLSALSSNCVPSLTTSTATPLVQTTFVSLLGPCNSLLTGLCESAPALLQSTGNRAAGMTLLQPKSNRFPPLIRAHQWLFSLWKEKLKLLQWQGPCPLCPSSASVTSSSTLLLSLHWSYHTPDLAWAHPSLCLDSHVVTFLISFESLFKCHLLNETFPDHPK